MASKPILRLIKGRVVEQWTRYERPELDNDDLLHHERWIPEEGPISHSGMTTTGIEAVEDIAERLSEGWAYAHVEGQ